MTKKVFFSLILLVLFLGGFFFLTPAMSADFGLKDTAGDAGYDTAKTDPAGVINVVIKTILGLTATVFFGLALFGGFTWLMARGNDEKVTQAKAILETAVIGLIIIMASYAISFFILSRLGTGGEPAGCCTVDSVPRDNVIKSDCQGTWQAGTCPAQEN